MMTRLRGGNMNGFRAGVFPPVSYNSPSPPIYPTERKLKKPMMEKHRRERMNRSMNELKERIVHAHPHESSKLEKADILEKTVLYVNELESQVEMSRRDKILSFQQGYIQACHELVELIAQHQPSFQAVNASELKQKLRQTVEKHLKSKSASESLAQQSCITPAFAALNQGFPVHFGSNRPTTIPRPIHTALPFMMPHPFALNCLPRLPLQPSSSLFPFPNTQLPRLIPSSQSTIQPKTDHDPTELADEEIDVEKVDEEKGNNLTSINTTTEDSGMESPTSAKSSSEVWRPF